MKTQTQFQMLAEEEWWNMQFEFWNYYFWFLGLEDRGKGAGKILKWWWQQRTILCSQINGTDYPLLPVLPPQNRAGGTWNVFEGRRRATGAHLPDSSVSGGASWPRGTTARTAVDALSAPASSTPLRFQTGDPAGRVELWELLGSSNFPTELVCSLIWFKTEL